MRSQVDAYADGVIHPRRMLELKCDFQDCRENLSVPGALVFSPPISDAPTNSTVMHVDKFHVCLRCWSRLRGFMTQTTPTKESGPSHIGSGSAIRYFLDSLMHKGKSQIETMREKL